MQSAYRTAVQSHPTFNQNWYSFFVQRKRTWNFTPLLWILEWYFSQSFFIKFCRISFHGSCHSCRWKSRVFCWWGCQRRSSLFYLITTFARDSHEKSGRITNSMVAKEMEVCWMVCWLYLTENCRQWPFATRANFRNSSTISKFDFVHQISTHKSISFYRPRFSWMANTNREHLSFQNGLSSLQHMKSTGIRKTLNRSSYL